MHLIKTKSDSVKKIREAGLNEEDTKLWLKHLAKADDDLQVKTGRLDVDELGHTSEKNKEAGQRNKVSPQRIMCKGPRPGTCAQKSGKKWCVSQSKQKHGDGTNGCEHIVAPFG